MQNHFVREYYKHIRRARDWGLLSLRTVCVRRDGKFNFAFIRCTRIERWDAFDARRALMLRTVMSNYRTEWQSFPFVFDTHIWQLLNETLMHASLPRRFDNCKLQNIGKLSISTVNLTFSTKALVSILAQNVVSAIYKKTNKLQSKNLLSVSPFITFVAPLFKDRNLLVFWVIKLYRIGGRYILRIQWNM